MSDTPADKTVERVPEDEVRRAIAAIEQQIDLLQPIIRSLNTYTPLMAERQLIETWYPQTRAVFEQDVNGQFLDEIDAVVRRIVPEPSQPHNPLGDDLMEQFKAMPAKKDWSTRYMQKLLLVTSVLNKCKQEIANDPEKYLLLKTPQLKTKPSTAPAAFSARKGQHLVPIIRLSLFLFLVAAGTLVFWHPLALAFTNQFSNPLFLQIAIYVDWVSLLAVLFGLDRKNFFAGALFVGITCSVLQIVVQKKPGAETTSQPQGTAITDKTNLIPTKQNQHRTTGSAQDKSKTPSSGVSPKLVPSPSKSK